MLDKHLQYLQEGCLIKKKKSATFVGPCASLNFFFVFKGIVQRDLTGVKSGVNP
jgi:hypothetical protein